MNAEARRIALDPKFFSSVRSGMKTSTVRKGRRDIRANECLVLTDDMGDEIEVRVLDVTYKTLGDLTENEAQRDGFRSTPDLFRSLKQFYPTITPQDSVTIIGFAMEENPSGTSPSE